MLSNYTPLKMLAGYRRQAWRVWGVGFTVVAAWLIAILAAPAAKASDVGIASPIYSFFSFICHQQSDRSFHIFAEQLAVCSRCFGVYFGLLAGFAAYPFWRSVDTIQPLPRVWLFLSVVPISIDWALTFFGVWENTHATRFITGLILGVTCAIFIVPALVEITRYLTRRRGTFIDSHS